MWRCAAAAGAGVWHFLCKTKATSASSWAAHPHDFTKCRVLHRLNVEGRRLGGQTHDGDGTETRERKSTMWNLLWKKKFVFVFSDRRNHLIYYTTSSFVFLIFEKFEKKLTNTVEKATELSLFWWWRVELNLFFSEQTSVYIHNLNTGL